MKVGELKGCRNICRIECSCSGTAVWIPTGNKVVDLKERRLFIQKHAEHEISSVHVTSSVTARTHRLTWRTQVYKGTPTSQRYDVRPLGETLGQKLWGIFDTQQNRFIEDIPPIKKSYVNKDDADRHATQLNDADD